MYCFALANALRFSFRFAYLLMPALIYIFDLLFLNVVANNNRLPQINFIICLVDNASITQNARVILFMLIFSKSNCNFLIGAAICLIMLQFETVSSTEIVTGNHGTLIQNRSVLFFVSVSICTPSKMSTTLQRCAQLFCGYSIHTK